MSSKKRFSASSRLAFPGGEIRGPPNKTKIGRRIVKKMNILRGLAGAAMAVALGAGHSPALAQADAMAVIKERGKLMAGVKYDTPPFGFQNKDNEIVGFDVDIVRKIAEDIGVPVEFVAVTSPTRIPMLASGNVDLVAASMTHTTKRDEAIDFTITYYTGAQDQL